MEFRQMATAVIKSEDVSHPRFFLNNVQAVMIRSFVRLLRFSMASS